MNLKTGSLFWFDTLPSPFVYPKLTKDIQCDVLIIGGGEAGSLCSFYLVNSGVDTVMVDKRKVAHGSSCANTGLLHFANDKSLTSMINTFGEDRGARFYWMCKQAVEELQHITSQLEFSPDYIQRPSLYFASQPGDVQCLQIEYEWLSKYGFPVTFLQPDEIAERYSFSKPAALYSEGNAEFNPFKLVHSLLQHAHRKGMRIYAETEITHHILEGDTLLFFTAEGNYIRCKKAIFATGYETQQIKRNKNAVLSSSYALVTQQLPSFTGWHERSLIWETARPYLYLRTTVDNRIVAGGLDITSYDEQERDSHLQHKAKLLLQQVQDLFPSIPDMRIEYSWAATFGETHDGLPLIGTQPDFPQCYFLLGYGGNGTVLTMVGAQIIHDLVVKGFHTDAHLVDFARV
ncbi:FAD-dependent oxidoreductase [Brevibacillus laterosporus]|uniref:NAD(P)/FAD-dependent oxidoreductase n=1 Tax=Brevibacillus laterosporus TaxID=1465 RepID=UPI0018CCA911|nr:FAD-dependent oxidoreductase [Brevibacillus laterosporus]MBG9800163.1 amino acid oxidase [Brevibacillus laterosporus]MCR8938268.1 FAD-binding oxidoreductase [Brevibacillus laterosporus]MCZ0840908.1 FAD-dependent oxidoreductase [Brevibacillus laterosporus]MCZ0843542.1 FAD-dependent oxidoreductase [Brevibacillus laterosporus]MED1909204.1 FAD-dependent oxidoreductase [Brevibacillus laterosporus]